MKNVSPGFEIPPLKASPLSTIDHVYAELKSALMAGEFSPGQPMRLKELAVAFGTSHMPIRESLNRLSGIGILERAPRRSTCVPTVTIEGLRDLLEVRLLNEKQAVMWAAGRCAGRKLTHIRDINNRLDQLDLERKSDIKKYMKLNQTFHFAVYSLSESRSLMDTIEALWLKAGPVLSLRKKGDAMVPGHQHHVEIINHLERGNGTAAAEALQRDIVEAHDQIFALLEKLHPRSARCGASTGCSRPDRGG
jgi:DNA-binding GntR family transcriptional regulator